MTYLHLICHAGFCLIVLRNRALLYTHFTIIIVLTDPVSDNAVYISIIWIFKGNGCHSEVRDKFRPNFQNNVRSLRPENYQNIWGHHSYKKIRWRHILIDKLPKSLKLEYF